MGTNDEGRPRSSGRVLTALGSYFAGREATYALSTISTSFPSSTSALPSIAPPW